MDVKRLVIAVVLSVIVVMGWNYLSVKFGLVPEPNPTIVQEATVPPTSTPIVPASINQNQLQSVTTGGTVTIQTPLYTAILAVNGGVLQSFTLNEYSRTAGTDIPFQFFTSEATVFAPMGLLIDSLPTWGLGEWKSSQKAININKGGASSLIIEGTVGNRTITREFTFSASTYLIQEKTTVRSNKSENIQIAYTMDTAQLSPVANYNTTKIAWLTGGKVKTDGDVEDLAKGMENSGTLEWVGIMDNYFLAAIAPTHITTATMRAKYENTVFRTALYTPNTLVTETVPTTVSTQYYIGPKDPKLLALAPNNLGDSVNYGFFAFLSRPLLLFLEFIYTFVHNYGIAIIVLTILIKLLFWPLSQKSFASMNKMKQIQPLVQEIRDKYKDDKQEMNKAVMALYKTYKVNPMGGCLPLLVQIPVFFALYEALLNSLALRHAIFIEYLPFTNIIWLADLSAKDPLYITPVAMGISMFFQQLLTPATGDPTQRKIMLVMPFIFTVFFLNFASGLVLYWLCSNIISILQQWLILRKPVKALQKH